MANEHQTGVEKAEEQAYYDILPSEIPDIDLYMDQLITLFERKLSGNVEKPLTKAMINNYSRENLVRKIRGKKYTREQIIQMLIVYNLKQVLSMQEIRTLFDFLEASGVSYERCYEILLEVKADETICCPCGTKSEKLIQEFLIYAMLALKFKLSAGRLISRMENVK